MLFYLYLLCLRPKIVISDQICQSVNKENGTPFYGFKIINNSRFFDITDIDAELLIKTPFNTNGGQNYRFKNIKLFKSSVKILPNCSKKNLQDGGCFALILTTEENLHDIWTSENQHLEFNVYARHSFSGATKNYSKKYYTISDIKKGMFKFGKALQVV